MKTDKNILVAFVLNAMFALFELVGGIMTGSVTVASDAVHDMGDAVSIGTSFFFEKISKKSPDEQYTYGYTRYSVLGGFVTTFVLLIGAVVMMCNAAYRIFVPVSINYDGMFVFAVVGIVVNFFAAYFTHEGHTVNQKAVNLHMLEDVLGWCVTLLGAVIMKFTNITVIDPVMCIGISIFIIVNALKNMKEIINILLERVPKSVSINEIRECVCSFDGVCDVHTIRIWSIDEEHICATMRIVSDAETLEAKDGLRKKLMEYGINCVTFEFEQSETS